MKSLAIRQTEFLNAIVGDETSPATEALRSAGLEIYRNNYRNATVEALEEMFERTARLAGKDIFRQVAIHHVIENPPTSWTLDLVGDGFPETCRALFTGDPDVGEIAWLEWAMARAFTARDADALSVEEFGQKTAAFDERYWTELRLSFLPCLDVGFSHYNLPELWRSLAKDQVTIEAFALDIRQGVIVWREGERPVFRLVTEREACCLGMMQSGAEFGEVCARIADELGPERGGQAAAAILRVWLEQGLIEKLI